MHEVVVAGAVRTAVGRRRGALAHSHPAVVLGQVQRELLRRTGVAPTEVGQVVGGCVSEVGEQSTNIARTAWLTAGLPIQVAATTLDAQCGSSQQATALAASLVASGTLDAAIGCGVEGMSRVPLGAALDPALGLGTPWPDEYATQHELTTQFEGAERIADRWGVTREDADAFGLLSQQRAARAWEEGRFDTQILPVDVPALAADGSPLDETRVFARDEGLRETSLEGLAALKPV